MFMNKLRKQTKYFLWIVVFGFIMWIAFDLGANLVFKRRTKPWQKGIIARVDGREIPYRVFEARYQRALNDTLKNLGDRELSYQEENAIKENVWREMLSTLRFNELMKKRHLKFNDEVYLRLMQSIPPEEIRNDTAFLDSTGRFDYRKYQMALGNPRNAAFFINYEYRLRNEILPREFNTLDIYEALNMTDEELSGLLSMDMEKRRCRYFLIKPFSIPDSLISFTDQDIVEYYNEHKDKYTVPRQYNLLVVRFPLKPSESDTLDAEERLKDVLFSLSQGDTFELLAKEISDDPSSGNGGDIGWIKDSGKYAFLYKVVKNAPLDSVIGPVQHGGSFYLVKKVDEKGDSVHVKIIRADIKLEDQTVYDIREKASNFADMAKEEDFKKFAEENGYKVIETGYFKENAAFARGIGLLRGEIKNIIKAAKKGDVVGPIKQGDAYIVFKVVDIREPYVMPLDSVKEAIVKQVKWEKKIEKAAEYARRGRKVVAQNPDSLQLWDAAKDTVKPIEAIVSEAQFSLFSIVDYNVGFNPLFKAVAFSLGKKELSRVYSDDRVGAFFLYVEDIISQNRVYPFVLNMKKGRMLDNLLTQDLMTELAGTTGVEDYRQYFLAN